MASEMAQAALNPFAPARSATSLAAPAPDPRAGPSASMGPDMPRSWLAVFRKPGKTGTPQIDPFDEPAARTLHANLPPATQPPKYPTNAIRTSKYSLLLFIPKNLSEQFRRVANIFFLTLAVIQFFPVFQTIDPVVSALPLIIIVTLTMIKDGFEDFKRHSSDNEVNNTKVYSMANWTNVNLRPESQTLWARIKRGWRWFWSLIYKPVELVAAGAATVVKGTVRVGTKVVDKVTGGELGRFAGPETGAAGPAKPAAPKYVPPGPETPDAPHFAQKTWAEVTVGDFVLLREGDAVPADILLLSSSEPENVAYVETKNLDGETNLKIRYSVPSTTHLRTASDIAKARFYVESEEANVNMYQFNGTLVTESGRDERLPVSSPSRRSLRRKGGGSESFSSIARSFEGKLETVHEGEDSPASPQQNDSPAKLTTTYVDLVSDAVPVTDPTALPPPPLSSPSEASMPPTPLEVLAAPLLSPTSGSATSLEVQPGTAIPFTAQQQPSGVAPAPLPTQQSTVSMPKSAFSRSSLLSQDPVLHLKILPVNATNMLLRGTVLRDTEWCIGFVVFTGAETKVIMNSGKTPSKRSAIEKMMNYHVLVNLFILAVISIVVAVANPVWENQHLSGAGTSSPHYLASASSTTFVDGLIAFLNALIQYQNIVPISLYLTVEIVKTAQAYFIYSDAQMYYEPLDRPCIPRAWNLSDDLGQIEYVFSDKTGTLTRNVMEFKACTVGGKLYAGLGEVGMPKKQSQAQVNLTLRRMSLANVDGRQSGGSLTRPSFSSGVGLGMNGGWEVSSPQPAAVIERGRSSFSSVVPGSSPVLVGGSSVEMQQVQQQVEQPRKPSPARSSVSVKTGGNVSASQLPPVLPVTAGGISSSSFRPSPALGRSSISPIPKFDAKSYVPPANFATPYRDIAPGYVDPQLYEDMESPESTAPQSVLIAEFFTLLAVCHSVLVSSSGSADAPAAAPEPAEGGEAAEQALPSGAAPAPKPADVEVPQLHYRAQSPDEAALVMAAKNFGIAFVTREQNGIVLDVFGEEKIYEVLNVLEFNSDRKRMSVIVRRPDESIVVYTKGADAVMYERLAPEQKLIMERTTSHLDYFAEQGLRTLVLACRELPEDVYQDWQARYHEASLALVGRESKVDACAAEIERDLTLLGSTAIEDKLQEGVPEAVSTMLQAGIHVCVLTGDKMETAINIGFSCNLLDRGMHVITVKGFKEEGDAPITPGPAGDVSPTMKQIREALDEFVRPYHSPDGKLRNLDPAPRLALVIDGLALKTALEGENQAPLLELITHCAAVICCRVSPLQKAQVVELVKVRKRVMCLAIGDGANDVSMIQAADIGVGIAGEEGLQAVSASDYAIAQFRFLTRLLLVHGHWNYRRTANMVFTFFYKNLIITIPLFIYQFYCGFSNSYIIDFNYLLFYQTFFTALSVIGLGIFDRDLDSPYLEDVPPLHIYGIKQHWFNARRFWLFMFEGIMQSIVLYFVVIAAYAEEVPQARGWISDQFEMGTTMAIAAIVNANLFVGINSSSWTWPQWFCLLFGAVAIFIYVVIYSANISTYAWGEDLQIYPSLVFWMTFLLVTLMMQGPRITYLYYFRNYEPTDINIIEEVQKGKLEEELEWAIETSRPPDDSEEHYVAKAPTSATSTAASIPGFAMPPTPGASPLMTTQFALDSLTRATATSASLPPPVLVPTQEMTDSPESTVRTSPYNVAFVNTMNAAGSVSSAGGGSMSEDGALRLTRGTSANIRDMQTDTIVPHRGYSFSQGRGASIIILGAQMAKIKERFKRTMSRGDRSSASSSRASFSGGGLFPTASNKSAGSSSSQPQDRLSALQTDPNFVRSLPTLEVSSPSASSGPSPPDRPMMRSESSPTSPQRLSPLSAGPIVRTSARSPEGSDSSSPSRIPGDLVTQMTVAMPSLDTILSADAPSVGVSDSNLAGSVTSSVVALSPLTAEQPRTTEEAGQAGAGRDAAK